MAVLYSFNTVIVRFLQTDEEVEGVGPPNEWDDSLSFDLETNEHVRTGMFTDWNAHRLVGGILRRDGQPVTINAPGEGYLARVQAAQAEEKARELLAGLAQLDILDFGYAYMARLLAKANGESMATILAIDSKATAQAYITGMSQWSALTAAQRQWLAVDLESRAYDAMVIRLFLT